MNGKIYNGNSYYEFNSKGEISCPNCNPSKQWFFLGAVRYNNFGKMVERIDFKDIQSLNGKWKHKNNKQKWHILDLDHGTNRVWMSPGHDVIVDKS